MIKSLPIENILSKTSLSSKKSIRKHDSSFRDVLDKTYKKSKNTEKTESSSKITPDSSKKLEKRDKHKEKIGSQDKVANSSYVCADSKKSDKTQAKKIDKKELNISEKSVSKKNNETKLNIKTDVENLSKKPDKDKKLREIGITDKNTRNIKSEKKETLKIIANNMEAIKSKKSKTNPAQKTDKKKVKQSAEVTKDMKIKPKYGLKNSKSSALGKNSKDEKLSVSKINNDVLDVKDKQKSTETQKISVSPNARVVKKKTGKSSNNIPYATVIKGKNEKVKTLAVKDEKRPFEGRAAVVENSEINKKSNLGGNLKNLKGIRDKYNKKLNIKKIELSKTVDKSDDKKLEIKTETTKKGHLTADVNRNLNIKKATQNQSATSKLNASKAQSDTTQTVVSIVKGSQKTVKLKKIEDVKTNRVIKIVATEEIENAKAPLNINIDEKNKKEKATLKEFMPINTEKTVKKTIDVKNFKPLMKTVSLEHSEDIDDNKRSKNNKESPLNVFTHMQTDTQIIGGDSKNISHAVYPMDKVIENINKMMDMKPPFNNTVTIKLSPPHIGVIHLTVKMDRDKNISALITAQDKDIVKLINSHTDGLKTYLNSQGIKVVNIDVHNGFHEQAGFGNAQNQGMFNANQQGQTGGHNFRSFSENIGSERLPDMQKESVYEKNSPVKGVDITV